MLDLLNRFKKNNDPLDGLKSAQAWWKNVQTGDLSSAHADVAELVNRFINEDLSPTLPRLQSLMWLDDQIQHAHESLSLQYVQNPRMSKTIESRLWHQVMGLAHHMILAYLRFIRDPGSAEEGKNASAAASAASRSMEPLLPRVMARTLRYLGFQAKFQYFRFLTPDRKFWATANQVFRLAEVKGVDSDSFPLYDSTKARASSCADEYLQIMMLASLNTGALSPRQLDIVDGWLKMWSHHISIERAAKPGEQHYFVDLSGYEQARRIIGKVPQGNINRFWSSADLVQQIGLIRRALEGGNKSTSLDPSFRQPGALDLVKLVESWWSPDKESQPHRGADRIKVKKLIDVMHGMHDICLHIKYDNERLSDLEKRQDADHDEMLDMRQYGFVTERTRQRKEQAKALHVQKHTIGEHETWAVENESHGGYGAKLPVVENDWVRLDALLAVRPENSDRWQLATIRRLSRLPDGNMYSGIQVLAYSPVTVELRMQTNRASSGYSIDGIDSAGMMASGVGVFTSAKSSAQKVNGLVMRASDYQQERVLVLSARGKEFRVRAKEALARGTDWVWVRVENDAAPTA